ncbi:MAG: hypothetical protein IT445_13425 [Phycisphaeraceae bacterium]|nr:hypothetical protein [Phycisphaeraceae bacterium]
MAGRGRADKLPASLREARKDVLYFYEVRFGADGDLPPSASAQWGPLCPTPPRPSTYGPHFGPELTFALEMTRHFPQRTLAVIKYAYGGTNLAHQWKPDATDGPRLFAGMVAKVRTALAALQRQIPGANLAGVCWIQGESDSCDGRMAAAYEENLVQLIHCMRRELNAPQLPFVLAASISGLPAHPTTGRAWLVHTETVHAAQRRVAALTPRTAFVETADLSTASDHVHLDEKGLLTLGERFAAAMAAFEQKL